MTWLALAIASAATLAAADVYTKKYFGGCGGWELVLLRIAVPGLLLLPLAFVYPLPAVPAAFWGWMALLAPLEIAGMLLYLVAIRDSPLYLTLPYLAFTPVFNVIGGYLMLGETVSAAGFAGVACVVAGAYLLNLDGSRFDGVSGWAAPLRALAHERGSRLMLLAALIYSLTSVGSKQAMGYATPASFGVYYFLLIGCAALALTPFNRAARPRALVARPGALLLIGLLSAAMVVTHFLAIALVQVAYFISVKRTSLLFAIALGRPLLGERFAPRHFLAGCIMVGGVALIVTG
jgi:drug/metabolite transporter (DMT)-like permease